MSISRKMQSDINRVAWDMSRKAYVQFQVELRQAIAAKHLEVMAGAGICNAVDLINIRDSLLKKHALGDDFAI